ncbi:hypothetical protein I6E44_10060 [Pseudoflavonifractor phocaeensis]|nr:hypothetical protein [Pseudoflavonifractor phocaeensis]MCF2676843.1 hypothetical protein [Pseudoflavonifractor phocaeensis]
MNDPNLRRLMIHGIILFGLILFALSCVYFGVDPLHPLSLLAGAIPFFAILVSFFVVRCPYCSHALPLRCLWTSYCPHCGEKLD